MLHRSYSRQFFSVGSFFLLRRALFHLWWVSHLRYEILPFLVLRKYPFTLSGVPFPIWLVPLFWVVSNKRGRAHTGNSNIIDTFVHQIYPIKFKLSPFSSSSLISCFKKLRLHCPLMRLSYTKYKIGWKFRLNSLWIKIYLVRKIKVFTRPNDSLGGYPSAVNYLISRKQKII